MDENTSNVPKFEAPDTLPPALPEPAPAPPEAAPLCFDSRDRFLLLPVLLAAYLFQELLRGLFSLDGTLPALGAFIEAGLLLGLLLWYARGKTLLAKAHLPELICAVLLTLSLALYGSSPLSTLNLLAAPALFFLWALFASGILGKDGRWTILIRGFLHSYAIRWKHVDKPVRAAASLFRQKSRTWLWVLLGAAAALLLSSVLILPLLRSADGVFDAVTSSLLDRLLAGNWTAYLARGFWALCLAFLIYSALYALRHDAPRPAWKPVNCAVPVPLFLTILLVVNCIYVFFVVIQFAYLFGGAAQLHVSGLSYAEYARSGFFQLVFVALLNLSLSMLSLTLCAKEGRGFSALRILSGVLLGMTAVILVSAAYRMGMYISVYGLSILRALTIWGMLLIALWLGFAAVKLARPQIRLFPFLMRSAILAWALLSLCNLNGIVAGYNANRYLAGQLQDLDAYYMYVLGPAALPAIDRVLDNAAELPEDDPEHIRLAQLQATASALRNDAREACGDWRSWNLQSALVGEEDPS